MASFKDLTTAVLLAMFCQLTTLSDCRVLQRDCRTFTAISCRAVAIGGGAVGGAMIGTGAGPVGTAIGAGVGAAGGQLLSEACDPFSKWLCGKRRLAMVGLFSSLPQANTYFLKMHAYHHIGISEIYFIFMALCIYLVG